MRRPLAFMIAVALPLALTATAPGHAQSRARGWARTVTVTPTGTYVVGNPRARVRLVEYLSFTCSHCAEFANESAAPLKALVARGAVSVELRHALRDQVDLAAAMLARCDGPRGFAARAEAIFATQPHWLPRAIDWMREGSEAARALPRNQALLATARGAGLDGALGTLAPAPARLPGCFADDADRARLAAMAEEAWTTRAIEGTPSFLINDRPAPGVHWAELAPQIEAALR